MLDKLRALKEKREDIELQLSDPEVINDMKRYSQLSKEYKDLEKIATAHDQYKDILSNIDHNKHILDTEKDPEFRELAKMELEELQVRKSELEESIKKLLVPKDPEDAKNAILEIRAGTGGDEASIFAGDLYRMYRRYFERQGWKIDVITENEGTVGGFKEIAIEVAGDDVYGTLKYESGVHRVQRVPETESQGRVHTSAASVVVLPEADEVDLEINDNDIRKDTFRASGAGGQHVNKTDSAIRLTHIPTGVVVECQDERSQIKNLAKAMKVLRARLYEMEVNKRMEEVALQRKTLVSTGDRSAKIRTYNYPQGRVTDHRIGLTLYNLDNIMNGEIEEIIDALQLAENTEKMKAGSSV